MLMQRMHYEAVFCLYLHFYYVWSTVGKFHGKRQYLHLCQFEIFAIDAAKVKKIYTVRPTKKETHKSS